MTRYLSPFISRDLTKKMVFLGGPRQVGKTTLALSLLKNKKGYLSWDIPFDRALILNDKFPSAPFWVLDEIHKYRNWRNLLKGLFDARGKQKKILVTGSARLDLYRYGGDSLQGRYFFYRLHPLSVAELKIKTSKELMDLLKLGGFPEPFFSSSEFDSKRWSLDYRSRLVREDLASLEKVMDLGNIERLLLRLPDLVGSPLSINALREDLQVSFHTAANWLEALERLYAFFRIPPMGGPKLRAVKKEQKHYHFDWTLVFEKGARFENLVACHLLKWCHFKRDTEGREVELRYFRDVDKREVDFVLMEENRPLQFIECKWAESPVQPGLRYLLHRYPLVAAYQISMTGKKDYETVEGIRVMPAVDFLRGLV